MTSPVSASHGWLVLEEAGSTQDRAYEALLAEEPCGIVLARNQTQGRGRHGRVWLSSPGDSLTMSLIFRGYEDLPAPHLIGLAVAIAAANAVHAQLQWPNDLVLGQKKVGGIITELKKNSFGRLVPIVGLGINLNEKTFPPEIAHRATSLLLERPLIGNTTYDALAIAQEVEKRLAAMPEPRNWSDLRPLWEPLDRTNGKRYRISDAETGLAIGIGSGCELICTVNGEPRTVLAADAIFGPA